LGIGEADLDEKRQPFDPDRVGHDPIDPRLNELTSQIIGAAIEVHRSLGPGHLESVYLRAMCIELRFRGIAFEHEHPYSIFYRDEPVGEGRFDLIVERLIVVELKAVERLAPIHSAQVRSYLVAAKIRLGLLINFNVLRLKDGLERIIN